MSAVFFFGIIGQDELTYEKTQRLAHVDRRCCSW